MARVIYAEDDPLVGELVQVVLLDAGHAVGVVGNGREALQVVRRRKPDLLILDITMPEMSGSEVLDQVRRDPSLYDLPVLMLTGRQGPNDENIALRAGATEYMRKPFDPDELVVLINSMIAKKREPDSESRARKL